MADRLVITGVYLRSTIEGTPLGLGGLKVNRDGVHLCSGYGRCHVSLSWEDVESIRLDADDGPVDNHDGASRGAPPEGLRRWAARMRSGRPGGALVTVSCRDGNVVVLRFRPIGGTSTYRDLRDRLAPYIVLIKQPA